MLHLFGSQKEIISVNNGAEMGSTFGNFQKSSIFFTASFKLEPGWALKQIVLTCHLNRRQRLETRKVEIILLKRVLYLEN